MKYDADDESVMVRYLLGELSDEDQSRVEVRFLRDREYLDCLRAVEEDLNDSYARGEMAESQRDRFEKRISASPEWRSRVEFSRALSAIDTASPAAAGASTEARPARWRPSLPAFLRARTPAFNFALAAAALVIIAAAVWQVLETRRLRTELEHLQAERRQVEQREQQHEQQTADARARADRLAEELGRERGQREELQRELEKPSPGRPAVSFILTPGLSRGEEDKTKLTVPPDAGLVRLQIYLQGPTPYKSYRAELRTVAGNLVLSRDNLAAQQLRDGKAVALSLPAGALATGKYELTLRGVTAEGQIEDVGYYYFSVLKK